MLKYAYKPKREEKAAKAYGVALRISTKNSTVVCKAISGKSLKKGKSVLEGLLNKSSSLDGKYYTNTASEILNLLKSAESNAEFKGLDTERLLVRASAHQGFTFMRPRRFQMRGEQRKVTNLQIVLEER